MNPEQSYPACGPNPPCPPPHTYGLPSRLSAVLTIVASFWPPFPDAGWVFSVVVGPARVCRSPCAVSRFACGCEYKPPVLRGETVGTVLCGTPARWAWAFASIAALAAPDSPEVRLLSALSMMLPVGACEAGDAGILSSYEACLGVVTQRHRSGRHCRVPPDGLCRLRHQHTADKRVPQHHRLDRRRGRPSPLLP